MPRKTKAQIELLLASLEAAKVDKRKAMTKVDDLEAEVASLNLKEGVYGSMSYTLGTPRSILDQPAAKQALTEAGIAIPVKATAAPIVVKRIAK